MDDNTYCSICGECERKEIIDSIYYCPYCKNIQDFDGYIYDEDDLIDLVKDLANDLKHAKRTIYELKKAK